MLKTIAMAIAMNLQPLRYSAFISCARLSIVIEIVDTCGQVSSTDLLLRYSHLAELWVKTFNVCLDTPRCLSTKNNKHVCVYFSQLVALNVKESST